MPTVNIVYLADEKDSPAGSARCVMGPRPPRNRITEYALRAGRTLLPDSRTLDELDAQRRLVRRGLRSSSWLGVPLSVRAQTIGLLVVQSYDPARPFTDNEVRVLEALAPFVTMAVRPVHVEEVLRASEARYRPISDGARDLTARLRTEEVQRAIYRIAEAEGARRAGGIRASPAGICGRPGARQRRARSVRLHRLP